MQNVFAGLNTRLEDSGLSNISLYIRNGKRKTVTSESGKKSQKLLESDLYFSVE